MPPLRRVALTILTLLLGILAIAVIATDLQRRRLTESLVTDAEAILSKTTTLPGTSSAPAHENGFACLADVLKTAPSYGSFSTHAGDERLAAAPRVSDATRAQLDLMRAWMESARGCADASFLKPVPGVRPFELGDAHTTAFLALGRATFAQHRVLAEEQRWADIADTCASTLELALDQTHLNLLSALTAENVLKRILPGCINALTQLDGESRASRAPRFAKLAERMATSREIMETERVEAAAYGYARLLSDEQRTHLPPLNYVLLNHSRNLLAPVQLTRVWRASDPLMRQLAEHADTPGPARGRALEQLAELESLWWVPEEGRVVPLYGPFLLRFDDMRTLLKVLALSAAGETNFPPSITRTSNGLVFMGTDGKTLELPLSSL